MPEWVTIFGRVNHLGTEPGTQVYSGLAFPTLAGRMSTKRKLEE